MGDGPAAGAVGRPLKEKLRRHGPIVPAAVFLLVTFAVPVAILLSTSVTAEAGGLTPVHFLRLFRSTMVRSVLGATVRIAGWTTLLAIVAAYPVAYLLATSRDSTRDRLLVWVLMPFWTSFLVRAFGWIVLLGRNGALSQLLHALGVGSPPSLIYNFTGVLIGMVHALAPLCVLTLLSVMENIDDDLTSAALTLGARPSQAFWRVYFPLSLRGVAAAALVVFVTASGFFVTPELLGGARDTMIAQVVIFQIQDVLDWKFASAIAILLIVLALAALFAYDRLVGLSVAFGRGSRGEAARQGGAIRRIGRRISTSFVEGMTLLAGWLGRLRDRLQTRRHGASGSGSGRPVLWTAGTLVLLFLAVPALFIVPLSFTEGSFLAWPPHGFSLHWYAEVFGSSVWIQAGLRSLAVATGTGVCALLLGAPASFYLTRRATRGRDALLGLLISPMVLPHIVIAVALFYVYARVGLVGTTTGLVVGHTVLAIPYVVITLLAVLGRHDVRYEQAAYTLGANPLRTFVHVTFPMLKAGFLAAFMFAFVISFDELTIALFVTGGRVTTLPKRMWDEALLHVSPSLAAVASVVLVSMTGLVLAAEALRRRQGRARATQSGAG